MPFLSQFNGLGTAIFFEAIRGLFDRIGPEVRAVSISYNGDIDVFYLNIYSEKPLSYYDREEFNIATTEMTTGQLQFNLSVRFFVVPMSETLMIQGDLFYKRKEASLKGQQRGSSQKPPWKVLSLGIELMQEVIIKITQALLDRMVFEVRAVSVDYDEEQKTIYLLVFSEKELSQEDKKDFEKAATEASAQISIKLPIVTQFFVRPMREKFPIEGRIIYYRSEPFPDEFQDENLKNYPHSLEWRGLTLPLLSQFNGFGREIFLETMRRLCNRIEREIRAVSISYDDATDIFYLNIYSEEPPRQDLVNVFNLAASEITAGLRIHIHMEARLFFVSMPEKLVIQGDLLYKRKESHVGVPK